MASPSEIQAGFEIQEPAETKKGWQRIFFPTPEVLVRLKIPESPRESNFKEEGDTHWMSLTRSDAHSLTKRTHAKPRRNFGMPSSTKCQLEGDDQRHGERSSLAH
jgi:hypothetical protein